MKILQLAVHIFALLKMMLLACWVERAVHADGIAFDPPTNSDQLS